jgi:hypothetical protein
MKTENQTLKHNNCILPGDTFVTFSGHVTSGFPKYSRRSTKSDTKKIEQWLIDNAIAEAKHRIDNYNLQRFNKLNAGFLSSADYQDIKSYLFRDESTFLILNN